MQFQDVTVLRVRWPIVFRIWRRVYLLVTRKSAISPIPWPWKAVVSMRTLGGIFVYEGEGGELEMDTGKELLNMKGVEDV